MNDFTKEELGLINRMFHHFVYSSYWKVTGGEYELRNKIQALIDDGCEKDPLRKSIKEIENRLDIIEDNWSRRHEP